jgi:hypothetical protein
MVKEIISVDVQLCECGCGGYVQPGKRFIWGHNMKSKAAREKQSLKTSKEWEDGIHDLDGEKRKQFYIDNPGARKDISDLKKEQYKNGLLPPNLGISHTDVTKQKMSDNHWDCAGENHPMYGRHHTNETKEELSKINEQTQSKWRQNQRWNAQVTNLINGTPITDWISRPSRHYDISEEAYNIWRHAVYERDYHTCRICGANHCLIHAHHIIPQRINQDLILDINNGITMCRTCHELTYGKEEIYGEELQMIVDGII